MHLASPRLVYTAGQRGQGRGMAGKNTVAAKSVLQAYTRHLAREKEEADRASKQAARRQRRSAERPACRGR